MEWYHYVSGFWSALFLVNSVPHYAAGIQGNKFPTPFANPSGKGLSSPVLNVIWGLINMLIGAVLFKCAHLSADNWLSLAIFFGAVCLGSIFLGSHFKHKHHE